MSSKVLVLTALMAVPLSPCAGADDKPSYTLAELRALARARHPSMDSARAALAEAEALWRGARRLRDPEARIEAGRARGADGRSGSEWKVELSQPFELPGLRLWRSRVAELDVRQAELGRRLTELVLDDAVGRLYVEALVARELVVIAGESEAASQRLHELLERRAALGESPPLEELKARSEWYARRQETIDAQRREHAALAALAAICGGAIGERLALAGSLATAVPVDEAALVERLRAHNPRLAEAEAGVEQARARFEHEKRQAFPGFAVSAVRESELDQSSTALGLGVSIPVWNRNRSEIAAAQAALGRAEADLRSLRLELELALRLALEEHRAAAQSVVLFEEGWLLAARQVLDIARFSFENGEASMLEVVDAERTHLAVRFTEVEARARLALAVLEIERLVAAPNGGITP